MPIAPVACALHVVTRGSGFEAAGMQRERDEVLDVSDWRPGIVRSMVDTRRLVPAPTDDPDAYTTCPCGRLWLDEAAAEAHRCPARTRRRTKTEN